MSLSQQQEQQRISLLKYTSTTRSSANENHHHHQLTDSGAGIERPNHNHIPNYQSIHRTNDDDYDNTNNNNNNADNGVVSKPTSLSDISGHLSTGSQERLLTEPNHPNNNHNQNRRRASTSALVSSTSSPSTVQLRPMGYLTNIEQRKRYRFIILMVLLCIGIAITLLTWFWFLHFQPRQSIIDPYHDKSLPNKYQEYYNSRIHDEMQQIANAALHNLNTNFISATSTSDHIPDLCETTVLVFRHCDKLDVTDEDDEETTNAEDTTLNKGRRNRHCSDVGYERAQYITTLFGPTNRSTGNRWPLPTYLYALSSHRDSYENYREYETLVPLSHMISVPIQNVTGDPSDAFANQYFFPLLTSKQICGQISVVSWKHHLIPVLVNALGCGPDNGCPMYYPTDTFDQVWELKFVFHHTTKTDSTLPSNRRRNARTSNDDDTIPSSNAVIVEPSVSTFHLLRKRKDKKKHHHHHHHHDYSDIIPAPSHHDQTNTTTRPHWIVIGTVTSQMFDPLQYSTQLGKYHNP